MTDPAIKRAPTDWKADAMQRRIRKRYASERRFKFLGLASIALSVLFLAFLLLTMISNGWRGFTQTEIAVPVDFAKSSIFVDPATLKGPGADRVLAAADFEGAVTEAVTAALGPDGATLISDSAWVRVREAVKTDPSILSKSITFKLPASSAIDIASKGEGEEAAEKSLEALKAKGLVSTGFSSGFFTGSASTDPAMAGIWGAVKGSLFVMLVTLALAFPIGVCSAVYLEEFAPKNRWTDIVEVSINNLAAIPSIIFGLLGLVMFIAFMGVPRSSALVAGLTLALMTFPVIVIAGRNAIKSVPPSIRDAALGVGASPLQVVFHHVLPLALPGIMTGTIIGMSRALGETAPLIPIGLRLFAASPPSGLTDKATVLPMQIFLWSDEVDRAFVEKTSAAIIVLLVVLLSMNAIAIYLRNKFEQRW